MGFDKITNVNELCSSESFIKQQMKKLLQAGVLFRVGNDQLKFLTTILAHCARSLFVQNRGPLWLAYSPKASRMEPYAARFYIERPNYFNTDGDISQRFTNTSVNEPREFGLSKLPITIIQKIFRKLDPFDELLEFVKLCKNNRTLSELSEQYLFSNKKTLEDIKDLVLSSSPRKLLTRLQNAFINLAS